MPSRERELGEDLVGKRYRHVHAAGADHAVPVGELPQEQMEAVFQVRIARSRASLPAAAIGDGPRGEQHADGVKPAGSS